MNFKKIAKKIVEKTLALKRGTAHPDEVTRMVDEVANTLKNITEQAKKDALENTI